MVELSIEGRLQGRRPLLITIHLSPSLYIQFHYFLLQRYELRMGTGAWTVVVAYLCGVAETALLSWGTTSRGDVKQWSFDAV